MQPLYRSKADIVEDHVRNQILSGQLAPGRQLRITEVSRELGMSDIPVREAFAHLATSGLLRLEPHKPAVVTEIGTHQIEELFAIRAELEGLAAERAAVALDAEGLARVEQALERMETARKEGRVGDFGELNREFHFAIFRSQPYERLLGMISELWDASARCGSVFGGDDSAMDDAVEDGRMVLDALRARDGAMARRLLTRKKQRIATWLIDNVEQAQAALKAPTGT